MCNSGQQTVFIVIFRAQVDLVLDLLERKTGGLSAGGGISAAGTGEGAWPGLIGSFSYNERNLFGLNQRLTMSAEIGQVGAVGQGAHYSKQLFERLCRAQGGANGAAAL